MEVVDVPGKPGKWQVLFNGSQIACMQDVSKGNMFEFRSYGQWTNELRQLDCPGAGLCALNQTWQVDKNKGECMCNTYFGFEGLDCHELGPNAYGFLVICAVTASVALGIFIWGAVLLLKTYTTRKIVCPKQRARPCTIPSPIISCLVAAVLGAVMIFVSSVLNFPRILGFPYNYEIVNVDSLFQKRAVAQYEAASTMLIFLAYVVSIFSFTVLPLAFLNDAGIITCISVSFSLCILGVGLPLVLLVISGYRGLSLQNFGTATNTIWIAIFAILVGLNALAFACIWFLRRSGTLLNENYLCSLFTQMQITSGLLVLTCTGALIFLGILPMGSARSLYDDPRSYYDTDDLAVKSSRLWVLSALGTCIWFVQKPIIGAAQNAQRSFQMKSR